MQPWHTHTATTPSSVLTSPASPCIMNALCQFHKEGNEWEAPWTIPYIQRASLLGSRTEGDGRDDGVLLSDTFSEPPTVYIHSSNVLLYQETNLGISYEHSVPKKVTQAEAETYGWIFGTYSECLVEYGGGGE
ncbi:hypothetical protein Pcinc_015675 [Petrolisthes cinctipes]|uniref:Uncharacterized protein n=1 Tax=Petrolisthes cinctipes TaxID=88211 RepID=A0AAE1FSK9_PETCI|nr:hypothetical protein Pcinc_015675 [Petrolisthes cinctipes]